MQFIENKRLEKEEVVFDYYFDNKRDYVYARPGILGIKYFTRKHFVGWRYFLSCLNLMNWICDEWRITREDERETKKMEDYHQTPVGYREFSDNVFNGKCLLEMKCPIYFAKSHDGDCPNFGVDPCWKMKGCMCAIRQKEGCNKCVLKKEGRPLC